MRCVMVYSDVSLQLYMCDFYNFSLLLLLLLLKVKERKEIHKRINTVPYVIFVKKYDTE